MYPKFLGMPLYTNGFPAPAENCSYADKTAKDLYYLNSEGKTNAIQNELLRSYMIYYISAPVFDNEYTRKLLAKHPEKMTIKKLFNEMMGLGLDPF